MSRPAGDPAALGAGARALAAAAEALRGVRGRVGGAGSSVVVAGAWRGPASEAFQAGDQATRLGLQRAAGALDDTAGAL
ncbi:MAG TPA: serine/threonine protein kinase, partial [Actinomycetes bacterium]|nr:serine/threonine protein kinase [Actinomycetes bacterium]